MAHAAIYPIKMLSAAHLCFKKNVIYLCYCTQSDVTFVFSPTPSSSSPSRSQDLEPHTGFEGWEVATATHPHPAGHRRDDSEPPSE